MPYTEEQRRLFEAAAHDKGIARKHGITQAEARKLADEAERLKQASVIDLRPVFYPRG